MPSSIKKRLSMKNKGHVKILLDWAVVLLGLLAFTDLARGRFGNFVEDCGLTIVLLLLNLDWPRHALKRNRDRTPRPARPARRLSAADREPETAW
jgi:hypothetical protein